MAQNLLDKLISQISPAAGLQRMRAREQLNVARRAYEGASLKDGWRPKRPGASANTDHAMDASTLRIRARALVQSVPYITRGLDSLVSSTIGTGIVPRSLAKNAEAVDALYAQFTKTADADGRVDLHGLQKIAYRAMEQDGEVLIRERPRRLGDGLPVPVQFQVLEIDWLDSLKTGRNNQNTIVNGIEYDALGKIVAYWLFDEHPGEQRGFFSAKSASRPVSAERIKHLFSPDRPGQGRGFSRLAPVIARVRDLQVYEDAHLQRKNLEVRLGVIYSGNIEHLSNAQTDADAALVSSTGELGQLASGGIMHVPAGGTLTAFDPKQTPDYVDYVKFNLHLIAAGMGVTYQMLTGDGSEGSFSSHRGLVIDFRRGVEQTQWLTVIPQMCEWMWAKFMDAAVLSGALPRADYACDWSTPKWDYVNPEQDVKADLAEISGGLSSISEKLRRRGYKPDVVFKEIKSDLDRLRADGTLEVLLQLQTNQASQPSAAANAAQAKAARSAMDDAAAPALRQIEDQQRWMARGLERLLGLAERTATTGPAPTPELHIHQAPITVAPADVRVSVPAAQVTVSPPTIEVRSEAVAPVVNITNEVTAQAGPTQVVVNPTTKSVATHERDKTSGEIVRTVTEHST